MARKVGTSKAKPKAKAKRPQGGRPAHEPTDDLRYTVSNMAACGVPHERIASVLRISHVTLTKYYAYELENGLDAAINEMGNALFRRGLAGDTTAAIFWLKTRARWRESPQTVEHTGKDGGPIQTEAKVEFGDVETARRLAFLLGEGARKSEGEA